MQHLKAEIIANVSNELGESPVWDNLTECLYWVDILGNKVFRLDVFKNILSWIEVDPYPSTIILTKNHTMIVTAVDKIAELPLFIFDEKDKEVVSLSDYKIYHHSHRYLGRSSIDNLTRRFNDGKADATGRLWLGTMAIEQEQGYEQGGLYCLDFKKANPELSLRVGNTTISNGMCWDKKRSYFYFIDSRKQVVTRYKWNEEHGSISEEQVVISINKEEGTPDGMTIDNEGMIWVAFWGGGKVVRFNPTTGEALTTIAVEAKNVTCLTFGGDDLKSIYITTAKDENGLGGDLYLVHQNKTGFNTFRGRL